MGKAGYDRALTQSCALAAIQDTELKVFLMFHSHGDG